MKCERCNEEHPAVGQLYPECPACAAQGRRRLAALAGATTALMNHARNSKPVFTKLHEGKKLTKEEAAQACSFYLETLAQLEQIASE